MTFGSRGEIPGCEIPGYEIRGRKIAHRVHHVGKWAAGLLLLVALASCQSANLGAATDGIGNDANAIILDPNPQGEVFGQGNVRIALLVPKTAPGNAATVANDLRNGALLAMQDFGQNTIQLVIKDTKGTAADTQNEATEAIN